MVRRRLDYLYFFLTPRIGISPKTQLPFSPPIGFRTVVNTKAGKQDKLSIRQGLCHKCKKWVAVEGSKDVETNVSRIRLDRTPIFTPILMLLADYRNLLVRALYYCSLSLYLRFPRLGGSTPRLVTRSLTSPARRTSSLRTKSTRRLSVASLTMMKTTPWTTTTIEGRLRCYPITFHLLTRYRAPYNVNLSWTAWTGSPHHNGNYLGRFTVRCECTPFSGCFDSTLCT